MKKYTIIFTILYIILAGSAQTLFAAGNIKKLKNIADSLGAMEKASKAEGKNYDKAKALLSTQDIRKGLSKEEIEEYCGEPVASVKDDTKWVYKPPSSTFFEGEKIYFFFDSDGNLTSWEQVYQD